MKKKVINKKIYTIEINTFEDNSSQWRRTNNGFSVLELMGMLSLIQKDLHILYHEQFAPKPPTEVVRKSTNAPLHQVPKNKNKKPPLQ